MVFRKSPHMDKYLDFQSHHPLAHKVAVARSLPCGCHTVCRVDVTGLAILSDHAEKNCSDFPDSEKEKEHVAKAPQNNGYPRRLVVKNWHPPPSSQLPEQDPLTATVSLLSVCHLSETIQRILAPLEIHTSFPPIVHFDRRW